MEHDRNHRSAQRAQGQPRVPTRRISFEQGLAELPKHFTAGGDLISSHHVALMSASFPEGEEGFVRSVRHYRDRIDDPELRRQVNGFIGQEASHGREHRSLNDRLAELGYPTKRVEAFMKRMVHTRERIASPEMALANTAAMEHFTAVMAELILSEESQREMGGDTVVTDLLLWHALEEAEHKAVAFDVFRTIGGSEKLRRRAMNIACANFVIGTTVMLVLSLLRDPATYRPGLLRKSFARFRATPIMSRETWRRIREYNREGFHPDDRDTTELVAFWREELFGEQGRLVDRLVVGQAA